MAYDQQGHPQQTYYNAPPPPPLQPGQPGYGYQPTQQPYYSPQQQQPYGLQYGQQQQQQQQQAYGAPPTAYASPPSSQHQQYVPPQHAAANNSTAVLMPPSAIPSSYSQGADTINPDSGLPAKFNPKPKYNDCWAFGLFLAQLAAFVVLSYFMLSGVHVNYNQPYYNNGYNSTSSAFFSKGGLISVLIAVAIGGIFAVGYFFLTQAFPRAMIKITFACSIILYFAIAIYYFVEQFWVAACFAMVFAILYASMWFAWKSRIPFATEMLRTVTSISKKYPATFAVSLATLFVQVVYSIYFAFVVAGIYEKYWNPVNNTAPWEFYFFLILGYFSFFWTSQVIKNIAHCTIAGVYATHYFLYGTPQGVSKSPTCASFKRATTTSIGSICFGSLIIAVIQTLRAMVQLFRSSDDNGCLQFLACIIDCFLSCIQGLAEFVNKYAFCEVAIYGKAFIPAAKSTWTMLQDRGVIMIINDNLIGNVWAIAAILGGILAGLGAYLYVIIERPFTNDSDMYVLVVIAFTLGLQMVFTAGMVIDSGSATTFVCLAEDPAALARAQPELFERIRQTWPAVVQGINY